MRAQIHCFYQRSAGGSRAARGCVWVEIGQNLRSKIRPYSTIHGCACTNTMYQLSAGASRALQWAVRSRPDSGPNNLWPLSARGCVWVKIGRNCEVRFAHTPLCTDVRAQIHCVGFLQVRLGLFSGRYAVGRIVEQPIQWPRGKRARCLGGELSLAVGIAKRESYSTMH